MLNIENGEEQPLTQLETSSRRLAEGTNNKKRFKTTVTALETTEF